MYYQSKWCSLFPGTDFVPYLLQVTETTYDINTMMTVAVTNCLNFPVSTPSSLFAVSCRGTMCHSLYKIPDEQIAKYIASGCYCLQNTGVPTGALYMKAWARWDSVVI